MTINVGLNQAQDVSPAGGVGTTPILLVDVEQSRKNLIIQNVSSVYMGFSLTTDTPSVSNTGVGGIGTIVLPPGAGFNFDAYLTTPGNAFYIVASSGSANPVTVIQW
jgi:hypothetical protein